MFEEIVHGVAYLFSGAGALLIIYGGIRAIVDILKRELLSRKINYNDIRRQFTDKITFGLSSLLLRQSSPHSSLSVSRRFSCSGQLSSSE